jgi:hypothetical protein
MNGPKYRYNISENRRDKQIKICTSSPNEDEDRGKLRNPLTITKIIVKENC